MTDLNLALHQLVAELEAVHAVVSPGSRNAPIIQSLIDNSYQLHSVVDERSAGFQALGMAKSLRQAVVLCCTSGTAGLNYYPAIAEAYYARIPLIVITADRPAESIDQWDGQAIRQTDVFLSHIRLSLETSEDYTDQESFKKIAEEVNECLANEIRGPIHINVPIKEPFYSQDRLEKRLSPRTFINNDSILLLDLDDYLPTGLKSKKILVFNGMEDGQLMILQCKDLESYENLLVLSDITSNQASSVMHWDAMLYTLMRNSVEEAKQLAPDILITTGTTGVSKGLRQLLKRFKPKHHFHFTRHDEVGDPFNTDPQIIDPYKPIRSHTSFLLIDDSYQKEWNKYTNAYIQKMINLDWSSFCEFTASKYVLSKLPLGSILHLANSMSVRLASFLVDEMESLEIYANRGTSGIDGCTSTALGNAILSGQTVYLMTGDLAFFYDSNAFLRNELPQNLKIIVLNNYGGRIFEMIDGPKLQPDTLEYQLTTHSKSVESLCVHFGLEYFCAENNEQLENNFNKFKQCDRIAVFEIKTIPLENEKFYTKFKNISYE